MARTLRTWIWVIAGLAVLGLLAILGLAAASVFYVSRHVEATAMPTADALAAFETERGRFGQQDPLYRVDDDRPFLTVDLATLPTSTVRPTALFVQAWNPDDGRLVRMSIPFWLLRMAPDDMQFEAHTEDRHFDFHNLHLDADALARIGPALVLDYQGEDGVRVLLWTD